MPVNGPAASPRRLYRFLTAVWLPLLLACLAVLAAGLPVYYRLLSSTCQEKTCLYFQLSNPDVSALGRLGLSTRFYAVYLLAITCLVLIASIGLAVILRWKAQSPMAALVSIALVALSPTFFSALTDALVKHNHLWHWPVGLLQTAGMWSLVVMGYLFPDGRFYPRWTHLFAVLVAVPSFFFLFSSISAMLQADTFREGAALYLLLISLVAGVIAQAQRYRHVSSPIEKQQIKWGVYGFSMTAIVATLFMLSPFLIPSLRQPGTGRIIYYRTYAVAPKVMIG